MGSQEVYVAKGGDSRVWARESQVQEGLVGSVSAGLEARVRRASVLVPEGLGGKAVRAQWSWRHSDHWRGGSSALRHCRILGVRRRGRRLSSVGDWDPLFRKGDVLVHTGVMSAHVIHVGHRAVAVEAFLRVRSHDRV